MTDNNGGTAITMTILKDLVGALPADVELTMVGGQAMLIWQGYFQAIYPEAFENAVDVAFGTQDIDFVVKDFKAVEAIVDAWRPRVAATVRRPDPDHATPNIAVIEIDIGEGEPIIIDFLDAWAKPNRIKNWYPDLVPIEMSNRELKVLGVRAVLLSKIANMLVVGRHGEVYAKQVRGAMLLLRLFITKQLDDGDRLAYRNLLFALELAMAPRIGSAMLFKHGVELLDSIPLDHQGIDSRYRKRTLQPALDRIADKRRTLHERMAQSRQRSTLPAK